MKARPHRPLFVALLAGLVLLTVAGLLLIGAYVYLSRQPSAAQPAWQNPLDAVEPEHVAPDLAVLPLAGYADDRVISAALDANEVETAYATLAYGLLMPDRLRSGRWILLATRFQESNPKKALLAYQAALDQVALGPGLSDMARADLALQVAHGYAILGDQDTARLALTEAENAARFSLMLLPAQRRSLLEQVAQGYKDMGDEQTATAIRSQIDSASAGPGIKLEPVTGLLDRLRGSVVLPEDVASRLAARQQAAADLAARWLSAGPTARAGLATALGEALAEEDTARTAFYATIETLPLPDRLAALHDRVAWLTVKYQVARHAYGTSLVPDWEVNADEFRDELVTAYTDLINGYGQQLETLSAAESIQARVELLQQGLLWVRLGLFPDHAELYLSPQLSEASKLLWTRQGGAGLVIVAQQVQDRTLYLLSGSARPQGQ